jgi:protein-S-isoprenylcysteine O-methyltransferase Ste14
MVAVGRVRAAAGSVLFLLVAPGVVVGVIPWWLTGWRTAEPFGFYWPLRVLGVLLLAAGVGFLLVAFARFVTEGVGTPAPVAPTGRLVVGGVYRHVRNPMYVAVVTAIAGQALLLGRPVLLLYAAGIALLQASFVRFHEEPRLRRRYGEAYDSYRREVPGWWPRLRPWRA